MKPFVPVLIYAAITFPMLALWNGFSGASHDLRPLLYLARLVAWAVAIIAVAALFSPLLWRRHMTFTWTVLLGAAAVLIHSTVFGFLTAHAEERVIQHRRATREPSDMGYNYMYAEFSGSGYSRGAYDAYSRAWGGLQWGLVSSFIWLPMFLLVSRRLYRHATPQPNISNA